MRDNIYTSFYNLMDQIDAAQAVTEKLILCEQARPLLAQFVATSISQDGDLPPCIMCRDYAPIWYMQLGQWQKAEEYIRFCISCKAYYPDNGKYELQYLKQYKKAAITALSYIAQNPGCLQSKIYGAIGNSVDRDCLKDFTRSSMLIKKVPYKKTNMLYVSNMPQ